MTNQPDLYPVELVAPDISDFASGNMGIPYVWRFDSGLPGPNVMLSAIVHGNEPCGAIALDWVLRKELQLMAGSLTFAFMNVAAYEAFDPTDPTASRWVDEDFNRIWDKETLEGDRDSVELRRAREVRPALEGLDFLLDLHSMPHIAPPVMMSGGQTRGTELAARIGVPEFVIADKGHAEGRRLRDYGRFDDPNSAATALLVECGQHWEESAGELAKETVARFLGMLGMIDPDVAAEFDGERPAQQFFQVTQPVTVQSDRFSFVQPFTGGEIIPKAGTIIGHDGDTPVVTEADNMVLVMPSKRLSKGQTAVRLATQTHVAPV